MSIDTTLPENFKERYGPWALIAGGSEGTGESFARQLAAIGINLILVARREAPLLKLRQSLLKNNSVQVEILAQDMTANDALNNVLACCNGKDIGLFIYNLGSNVHYDRFTEWPTETLDFMLKMNCEMPLHLSHHFAKDMKTRGKGGIIFLGSLAGLAGAAYMSIYPASKAYLQILAEGLWHDLMPLGIDVMCSILGATNTPSHAHMKFDEMTRDDQEDAQPNAMECDDVASETLAMLGQGPVWVVGEHNRAILPEDFLASRPFAVEMMSMNTAQIAGIEHTPVPPERLQ
ncbi:MAG: SDR family NAD(P)-dependent oxidoreductase [Pseudomonadales bacterium]